MNRDRIRVAMISVGLGKLQRGFERYFGELYQVVRSRVDLTLYKGGGERTSRERIPHMLRPMMAAAWAVPLGGLAGGADYAQYRRDCVAYGLSVAPELVRRRFDAVHIIDPPLVKVLGRILRTLHVPSRILFTEGSLMPPPLYPANAHIHHVGEAAYRDAVAMGVPESGMTLVACGIDVQRFSPAPNREELRQKYGIRPDTFVVLVVSALRRIHKRVHHVINEIPRLEGDVLLWLDGSLEDAAIPELARRKLGDRCRITHVPSAAVPELLNAADVMTHGATDESFGLAVAEAVACGVPVLAHDSPHFEWLTGDRECLVDMRYEGRLAARLAEIRQHPEAFRARARDRAAAIRSRFGWEMLAPAYEAMYRKVAQRGYLPAFEKANIAEEHR